MSAIGEAPNPLDVIGERIEKRLTPTRVKRLERFVDTVHAIEEESADAAGSLSFAARMMTQISLPQSERTARGNVYSRRNGNFQLHVLSAIGLPYGHYPRLLLTWMTTEAVRTKSSTLELGDSLSAFMDELGLTPTGGTWGSIRRLQDHMRRLFSSTISWTYEDGKMWLDRGVRPVSKSALWWDPKKPAQAALFRSTIELSKEFYDEIIARPVPVDMRALKALARDKSPLAIDIYTWLTYRMSYLQKETCVPWHALHLQFGGDYARVRDFKKYFIQRLKVVLELYPAAQVSVADSGLKLAPSATHIPARCS
jgi:hypothetical protein